MEYERGDDAAGDYLHLSTDELAWDLFLSNAKNFLGKDAQYDLFMKYFDL